ncbi:MAG: DnaJ C-terminal domain-containing protein, partial [Myxococcota bacterium]
LKPHQHFKRQGLDLYLTLPVTLNEAYSGTTAEVPTPSGRVKLRVPPLSQNGSKLRLRGKGVPRGKSVGDMYAVLDVRMPERSNAQLEDALKEADALYPDLRGDIEL